MALKPYEKIAPVALAFPIGGKVYTPPPVSLKLGVMLAAAYEGGESELLKQESRTLWQLVLGAAYDEMLADEVPLEAVTRAGFTVLADWQDGREAAERVWESGIDPELRAAMKAASRGVASTTTSPSMDAVESSTSPQANTSDTKTSPVRQAAPRPRGRKSSSNGT